MSRSEIEKNQDEQIVLRPLPGFTAGANIGLNEVNKARRLAKSDLSAYWEEAADRLDWFRKWDQALTGDGPEDWAWFAGAKCNIIYNALDRHIQTANKNKLALIWEGEPGDTRKYTYYELYREVNRCAEALRSLGVGKKDRVVVYMPALPETMITMLAAAKIGAVHCLVFAGYSAKVLRHRIAEIGAKAVVTCDGFYRNGHVVRVKDVVDKALMDTRTECVDSVVVVHRANMEVNMREPRDVWFEDLVRQARPESVTEVMDADDPLFILHTSGSTGQPKTVIHSHGGYMVGVHQTFDWVFDIKPTDIYWCTAELSWITGHSYAAYGPLMAGTTTVMFEGHPLYPKADRLWRIVAKYGVNIIYTSPTMIRMLKRYGSQYPKQHDLSTLRLLATVGEPISPETWMWYYDVVGNRRCPVLDTWWQTETGMIMISPLPVAALKPGSVARPLPGVEADVVDENGESCKPWEKGFLTIKNTLAFYVRTRMRPGKIRARSLEQDSGRLFRRGRGLQGR